jgi:RNA polymerase primary sigma factor
METSSLDPVLDDPDSVLADPFGAYLRRIGTVDLLSAAEEVELAAAIEAGVLAAARLAAGVDDVVLAAELRQLATEGERARLRMIRANLRLVVSLARRQAPTPAAMFDLVQDGTLGLIHAVRKFDYRRGYKFSTYASWWIRQAISRGMADAERTVRLPVNVATRLRSCLARQAELAGVWGRDPTAAELAEVCGSTPEEMAALLRLADDPVSLELVMDDLGGEELLDRHAPDPGETVTSLMVQDRVREALAGLSAVEREVVSRRFGLHGPPRGRGAVAAELGLGRGSVRRIEQEAIDALRATPTLSALVEDPCPPLAS